MAHQPYFLDFVVYLLTVTKCWTQFSDHKKKSQIPLLDTNYHRTNMVSAVQTVPLMDRQTVEPTYRGPFNEYDCNAD